MINRIKKRFLFFLALFVFAFAACEAPSLKANRDVPPVNSSEKTLTELERYLKNMEDADFAFVYVLRRKDGGVFDNEDKNYIRANAPDANRRILTDGDKALVLGSNFPFPPENLNNLIARFAVYDYSKPKPEATPANANTK